jgi:SAM-dependent methyltransferase
LAALKFPLHFSTESPSRRVDRTMPSAFQELDWYESPLYYDIIFEEDTDREGAFLEMALARYGFAKGKRVLEPACGSGRLLGEMARRGYDVTGFDLSPEMLEFAKERLDEQGFEADLFEKRMESFKLRGRFDLAHCLVSTFKYLLTEEDARGHLECVAKALVPGGIYVLGMHLSDYEDTHRSRERWVATRDETNVVCNIQGWPADRKARTERVRSRMVVKEHGVEKRMETNWTFRTYDARQLKSLLRSVPEFEHVATYDFCYELDGERTLSDAQLDCVLLLRKR